MSNRTTALCLLMCIILIIASAVVFLRPDSAPTKTADSPVAAQDTEREYARLDEFTVANHATWRIEAVTEGVLCLAIRSAKPQSGSIFHKTGVACFFPRKDELGAAVTDAMAKYAQDMEPKAVVASGPRQNEGRK